jgi:hypothetical protein
MAAARTVHKGVYNSDILGVKFRRRTDDHFFTQAPLGWGITAYTTQLPLPSTLRPRHAECVDSSGRRHSVVIADVTADIWTRVSSTINILDDTGALDAAAVTGLVGEAITL